MQYLVLGHACNYPELTNNIGNIALLKLAGKLGLVSMTDAEAVLEAYREFRLMQHQLRLNPDSGQTSTQITGRRPQKFVRIEIGCLQNARITVLQLWKKIFGV